MLVMGKITKHPSLSANSMEGLLSILKELLTNTEPHHTPENISFIISSLEKEVEEIRKWCEEEYRKNMSPSERLIWDEVKKFNNKHKKLLDAINTYNEAFKEYQETIQKIEPKTTTSDTIKLEDLDHSSNYLKVCKTHD